ncbi:MAG: PadR family transcriptional regulator [Chloroflexota bacterium]
MCNEQCNAEVSHSFCAAASPGRMVGFTQAWILLLLSQGPAHGYQLLEALNVNEDISNVDPGFVYRTLRTFESEGLLRSSWETEGHGPARRVYEITSDGLDCLKAWTQHIRSTRDRLERLLGECERKLAPPQDGRAADDHYMKGRDKERE